MSQAASEPAVELRDLAKHYIEPNGETLVAVNRINLTIYNGEFFSLLGPSGCGKTTTLRMIAGLELPTSGSIVLYGEDVSERPPYRRPVNTVFQRYALFPHMTVRDNVAFGLKMRKVAKGEITQRVDDVLRLVRLERQGERRPGQLSGGQQQRVALARALVNNPEVLLLDEPLGALDLKLRQAMQEELKRIQREVGITFIYVTHDQEEALTLSDRIAVMNEGNVLQVDKPYDLYEEPTTRFVADFIGETNFLDGVVTENDDEISHVRLGSGQTAHVTHEGKVLPPQTKVALAIRPEKIFVGTGEPPQVRNVFEGTVKNIVYLGTDTYYDVELPGAVMVTARQQNEDYTGTAASAAVGDAVYVAWRAHNASLLTE
ncbi:MAG: ABC transporter ATP-binding protein [Caldilineaceae bacterium]|nr:ABC transporter ATP-binding protein [Caldilineaceae bacterium]